MKSLSVTIGGQPFDHLVYHWVCFRQACVN
jgi:hypothetical protein